MIKGLALACILSSPHLAVASKFEAISAKENIDAIVGIKGVVKDNNGNPVVGATVMVKGTKSGVKTDQNGSFSINVPSDRAILVVSYLGLKTQEVPVNSLKDVIVVLEPLEGQIEDVVVTGYGSQRRSEIVGSISTIKGEELMDIPAPNIAGALRNRIAGVGVNQESGRPGSRISLNVRGSSISSNAPSGATDEPLYIIDGIVVSSDVFDNLDASMVENISILKDASAAIYGAAGAKGVVLVTTKRGKVGKPSITYNGYAGITDAATKPDLLSAYDHALLLNEGHRINNSPEDRFFSPEDLEYLKGLNTKSWYDQIWQASLMQRHNVSVSGGSDRTTYFVGGSYQNENGNYAGMKQDKYSMRSGLTATIIDGLKADINFNVDHRIRESKNNLGNGTDNDFFEALVSAPQWIPLQIDGMPVFFNRGNVRNPLAITQSGYSDSRKSQSYRINASLSYQPKFIPGLTAKLQVSQGGGSFNNSTYIAPYKLYNFERMGNNNQLYSTQLAAVNPIVYGVTEANSSLTPNLGKDNGYQGFITLNYANTFGKHSFDIVGGAEQTVNDNENLSVRWDGQMIPDMTDYWAFDQNRLQIGGRSIGKSTKRSFFGRMSYDFDKKYLIQAVSRIDASSNFARGDRWGVSPSIGAGWVVSQENFFKDNISFINFLKLKINYGIAGDDRVDERLWQERYTIDLNNGYLFGDNNYGIGLNPSVYPNLVITWEKKRTLNFGFESSLFNNKLDIGVEYYQNKVFDGFDKGANEMNPLYAGLLAPTVNYREAYNWGTEVSIGYRAKIGSDLNLNANMNFGYGNSIVTQIIYNPADLLVTDRSDGKWLGTKFGVDPRKYNNSNMGYKTNGMFRTQEQVDNFLAENPNYTIAGNIPQAGWLVYEDTNGDGMVNQNDIVPLFENNNPFFSSGITLGLGYKAFNFSTNFLARLGGRVFYDSQARNKADNTRNVVSIWKDRWTPENPLEGKYPRTDDPLINVNSDFWAANGTTIRVNNMTLSYRIPANAISRLGFSNARVLLTGNNLWTIVNPYGYKDPYSANAYHYPITRTISVGLSANL
ncbi:TonB-dependent receptor [Sphingobacterium sp. WQ 366]|uniref:TonB-dependent receptor n=2 Tax=Sphingobacterium bovistauri TaxID=2781959 RepID=A0ABS7Z3J3_9SPHI|nr:TonB-dependent receptor [Sphingobacterium bovistauri]